MCKEKEGDFAFLFCFCYVRLHNLTVPLAPNQVLLLQSRREPCGLRCNNTRADMTW